MRTQSNEFDETMQMSGWLFRFVKLEQLPTSEEAELLEWRTLDLMNNFFYSHTTRTDEIVDLTQAICSNKLDIHVLLNLATRYGTQEAKRTLDEAVKKSGTHVPCQTNSAQWCIEFTPNLLK